MKKILALLLVLSMVFALAACGKVPAPEPEPAPTPALEPEPAPEPEPTSASRPLQIGISMPTRDLSRRIEETRLKQYLEDAGYVVDRQYADNKVEIQISQIEAMIDNGARILVITAIDASTLGGVLAKTKKSGCTVIAYDRLILGSDAVSYYASFDNKLVGQAQGQYIVDTLKLAEAGDETYNIEFITGDTRDLIAKVFYDSAMRVLQPYLDSGVLTCQSGQVEFEEAATNQWSTADARERFENILQTYYADKPLDAVLASNDSTAQGVADALTSSYSNEVYPIITGQDCDIVSVKNILKDRQAMSVFKNIDDLEKKVVEMCQAIMEGNEPPVNDTSTYDNGTGIIPSCLCAPVVCTKDNYKEILIDFGHYTKEQLAD